MLVPRVKVDYKDGSRLLLTPPVFVEKDGNERPLKKLNGSSTALWQLNKIFKFRIV